MKKRKICFVTGSRAEYGMQYFLMKKIKEDRRLNLKIIVTGSHLSKKFGYTVKEILRDKFLINEKIKILSSSKNNYVAESTSKAISKISSALQKINPDILVLVGDRYEIFASAYAALINRIPIAHIHGGETTLGAFDESLRHSISKMSYWHFVSNKKYKKRLIQLGENPNNIFISGGLGVDTIKKTKFLNKNQLQNKYKFNFKNKNLLVTYHPVTLSHNSGVNEFKKLLKILSKMKDTYLLFTSPNSDTDNKKITNMIKSFKKKNKNNSKIFHSLGRTDYFSILKNVDAVIGNSSSGLLEAPTLKTATINIGDRQKGKVMNLNIFNSDYRLISINKSYKKIKSKYFEKGYKNFDNVYHPNISLSKVVNIIKNIANNKNKFIKKKSIS